MVCRKSRFLRVFIFVLFLLVVLTFALAYLFKQHLLGEQVSKIGAPIGVNRRVNNWIHTKNYQYLLNNDLCEKEKNRNIFIIVLVNSTPKGIRRRQLVRRTWGSPKKVNSTEIKTVFILGRSEDAKVQQRLRKEQAQYGDLVQIDFYDSYDNLTIKTVMGLRWVMSFCPNTKFVMKTDDDMFVNYVNLVDYLQKIPRQNQNRLYAGNCERELRPIRKGETDSKKWEISFEEYPGEKYPPYCSGSGFVLSLQSTKAIYQASKKTKFFRLEDVFVGICAKNSGILATHYIGFGSYWYLYSECRYSFLITVHHLSAQEMEKIWRKINHPRQPKMCPSRELLIEWYDYDDEDILNNVMQFENDSYYEYIS